MNQDKPLNLGDAAAPGHADNAKSFSRLRDPARLPANLAKPVVAIGNFDGVHLGHKRVIGRALGLARELGRPAAVLTFDPHPRDFFQPDHKRFRLTPPDVQADIVSALGVAAMITLSFDRGLADLSADAFVEDILLRRLGVVGVVAGADFHFGQGRSGSPATLRAAGERLGFAVGIVDQFSSAEAPISSSRIRRTLTEGDLSAANAMLGYEWFVRGEVIHGQKIGRTLGFPTANIALDRGCGLKHGIYAVRIRFEGRTYGGVASFGRRPTFDNGPPLLEVVLFDFSGDLYGKTLDVAFVAFLRQEMKFEGVPALVEQMNRDGAEARRILDAREV